MVVRVAEVVGCCECGGDGWRDCEGGGDGWWL